MAGHAAVGIVSAHAVVALLHVVAHVEQGVWLEPAASAFVLLVVGLGPFAALAVMQDGRRTAGAVLLAATMAASLGFGLWSHFVAAGPDHVGHLAPSSWAACFRWTAVLLAASEVAGVAVAWNLLANCQDRDVRASSSSSTRTSRSSSFVRKLVMHARTAGSRRPSTTSETHTRPRA